MKKLTWLLLMAFMAGTVHATVMDESLSGGGNNQAAKPAALPNTQLRVHDVGKLWLSITNYGFFGSQGGDVQDAAGIHDPAPGCEFPGGSNLDYLFQGALWVGAEIQYDSTDAFGNTIQVFDTLVSIGNDGWWADTFEFYPEEAPAGAVAVRSIRPSNVYPYGDTTDAISEQDYVSVYYDTVTASFVVPDPNDQRPHIPLGIRIEQRSYAWSYEYAEDFVLFDFDITNIGQNNVNKVWIGMYIDADCQHISEGSAGAQDDLCGFDSVYVSLVGDTTYINTAWIADNDGNPNSSGVFDHQSPRGLSGVRVVRAPGDVEFGFNWWISNINAAYDWGPQLQVNYEGPFPGGGDGTPGGDKAKYKVMSNHEFDYDQIWCNLTRWESEGWRARSPQAADLANGYDTRYLFSFGEFESIPPGDVLKLTTGYICGEDLHVDPTNYTMNLANTTNNETLVRQFYENLDFTDFATNSQWASWVYDNPGVDTAEPYADLNDNGQWDEGEPYRDYDGNGVYTDADGIYGDGFRVTPEGDTFWFAGDGVPDFKGPPPPPSPDLQIVTAPGSVILTWEGDYTESFEDNFLRLPDFEGYRIYMSRTGQLGQYTLLADYDRVDFDYYYLDNTVTPPVWRTWDLPPATYEELLGTQLDPNDTSMTAPRFPTDPDSLWWVEDYVASSENWIPYGWNTGFGTVEGNQTGDHIYSFSMDNLSETVGIYFSVTAYDYGNPVTDLSPLESSPTINAKFVYPIARGEVSEKIFVYPNPYKISNMGYYLDQGYEDTDRSGNTQLDRRIWFSGFPAKSTVRIFSLDGDLVRQLEYDPVDNDNNVISWDLISRNTQAVVSGIYIYAIESEDGYKQLGKIAIIK